MTENLEGILPVYSYKKAIGEKQRVHECRNPGSKDTIKHKLVFRKPINGILLLDKPQGLSSNQALQQVKRLFSAKKAGHTGSLDPLATGLLPICLGEATKFCQFLLEADKQYWVQAQLGIKTHTGDREGECMSRRAVPPFKVADIQAVLSRFQGTFSQIPPMFSALKYQGKPLYQWARQGIEVNRSARDITITELNLLGYTSDTFTLEIRCSKGTYVRSLVDEIGEALGCGAHVVALRRLSVAAYQSQQMVSVDQIASLKDEARLDLLLPLETALSALPVLMLSEAATFYLRRGQALALPGMPEKGWVRLVLTPNEQFIGVGQILADGRVAPYRLMAAMPEN